MHKRFILTTCLLLTGFLTHAQELNNVQLLKLYGLMQEALSHSREQLAEATRLPINQYLSSVDKNWNSIAKDDRMVADEEMWFTWNYYNGKQVAAFVTPTYKIAGNGIQSKLEYYTPNASPYNSSLAQISSLGKLVSKTSNKYTGTDITYRFKGLTYLYSTFPPRKDGFKLYGKPVTLYKVTISKDL